MFKISPAATEEEKALACAAVGTVPKSGAFVYRMTDDDGTFMGMSQFDVSKDEGELFDLREPQGRSDFEAMFILGRQTLNFIDLCGNHACRAGKDAADERLLRCIGFKADGDGYFANLEGMFDGHCDGHPVDLYKQ